MLYSLLRKAGELEWREGGKRERERGREREKGEPDFVDKASRKSLNKGAKAKKKRKRNVMFFFLFWFVYPLAPFGLRFDVLGRCVCVLQYIHAMCKKRETKAEQCQEETKTKTKIFFTTKKLSKKNA